ncbi:hypothetical protein EAH72_00840 [Pseudomonas caspiana]|nr:hypothetical protein EAH72_00840 [Pseudomonas caspiana]
MRGFAPQSKDQAGTSVACPGLIASRLAPTMDRCTQFPCGSEPARDEAGKVSAKSPTSPPHAPLITPVPAPAADSNSAYN